MINFLRFFAIFFFVEFFVAGLVTSIILLVDGHSDPFEKVILAFLFINFAQLSVRNLMGNYYFSWKLMRFFISKKVSLWKITAYNCLCVLLVFFALKWMFGAKGDVYDVVLIYKIGIPMAIGVVVSSFVMVSLLKKGKFDG